MCKVGVQVLVRIEGGKEAKGKKSFFFHGTRKVQDLDSNIRIVEMEMPSYLKKTKQNNNKLGLGLSFIPPQSFCDDLH